MLNKNLTKFDVYPVCSLMKSTFWSKITTFESWNYYKQEPKDKMVDYRYLKQVLAIQMHQ